MKILVAISSCAHYEPNHIAMRETWLPAALSVDMDYAFFIERGHASEYDIVSTGAEYGDMTARLKFKLAWGYDHGYDFVFSCFPDTYARPERILTSGFDKFDCFGTVYKHPSEGATPYCQGGAGYLVSRRVMELVKANPTCYMNDDCWLGDVLHNSGLTMGHSEDFKQWAGRPEASNTIITNHLSYVSNSLGVPYTPKFMYDEHQHWLDSGGLDVPHAIHSPKRILRWQRH